MTPLRVLTFERQTLMRVQRRQPEFRLALDAAFNTNLRRKLTAANKLATTDPLTGIANRRSLFDAAGGEMQRAQRYGDPFSIIMIDIDHFKQINDTIGHAGGDHVLTEIAGLCVQICRADLDVAGRVGGEEFAIVMPGTGVEGASDFAERLRAAISAAAIVVEGKTIPVTASFGVAAFQAGDHTIANLFKRADDALYNAKATGRNRVVVKVEQR